MMGEMSIWRRSKGAVVTCSPKTGSATMPDGLTSTSTTFEAAPSS